MSLVDLTYRNSLLHGVVGAEPIRIAVAGRPNRASYAGTCSGHDFVLDLQVGSNHRNVNPTTELRGSYDGAPVELTGTVHLTPYFALRHVDITGTIGDHRVTAVVSSVEAPASGPAVLSIDGHFDDTTVTVYAAVGPAGRVQRIEGLIGGKPLRRRADVLRLRRSSADQRKIDCPGMDSCEHDDGMNVDDARSLLRSSTSTSTLRRLSFDGLSLPSIRLLGWFDRCSFVGTDLRMATLDGAFFKMCDFRAAKLEGASLRGSSFGGCDLSSANLRNADLSYLHLGYVNSGDPAKGRTNLTGADLTGTTIDHLEAVRVIGWPPDQH